MHLTAGISVFMYHCVLLSLCVPQSGNSTSFVQSPVWIPPHSLALSGRGEDERCGGGYLEYECKGCDLVCPLLSSVSGMELGSYKNKPLLTNKHVESFVLAT